MAFDISAWAIRKPAASLVLFALLIPAGCYAFSTLPVANMPEVIIPAVSVTIAQPGASPAELEEQVTTRVEDAVAGLGGVEHVQSSITEGSSTTVIEFSLTTPIDRAMADVRDAAGGISDDLPQSAAAPVFERIEGDDDAVATYAVSAPAMTGEELSRFVDDTLARALMDIHGVARVRREGGADREIRVVLDPVRLLAFAVTVTEVDSQLRATNLNMSSGRLVDHGRELSIRTLGGAAGVHALAATPIILPSGRQVALDELGSVTDGIAEPRASALLNGEPAVAFSVYRAKGASDIAVAEGVSAKAAEMMAAYPGLSLDLVQTKIEDIRNDYHSTMWTLIEGAALAIAVVFLFLRNARATVITSLAIPLSIIPTFLAMMLLGFSLNTLSLLAITLVTGVLVDDAIVEIENIERHMRMGKSAYQAALDAAAEIGLAVVATTASIAAIFAPVSFMPGIPGQYFKQFGITVAVAVAFSLLAARLITPLLAAYGLRAAAHSARPDGLVLRWYLAAAGWSVRRRYLTIAVALAMFAGTAYLATLLPAGFLPGQDTAHSSLRIELPPGSTLAQTERAAANVTRVLMRSPDVKSVYALIGGAGEVRKADLSIALTPRSDRSAGLPEFEANMQAALGRLPDLRASFGGGGRGKAFTLNLRGTGGEDIGDAAVILEDAIGAKVRQLRNVTLTTAPERPEIRIVPKLSEAADLGVSVDRIASTIRIATLGDASGNLAKLTVGGRQIGIRVQLDSASGLDMAALETLGVRRDGGGMAPLAAVAGISTALGPATIERYDRQRRIVLEGDLAEGAALGEALAAVRALPEATELPEGVTLEDDGDAELMAEVFSGFIVAMAAGLILLLAVLVLLFGSVLQPLTILLSLPLSAGGAFIALLATGHDVSLPVVIGFLMLAGIVAKNAILLVDAAIAGMARGLARDSALAEAGRKRAQPIIMTTVAMVAGMLPAALALTEGGEIRSPMAITVIGGLLSSTALSLIFVPALFAIMDDLGGGLRRLFGHLAGPVEAAG